MYTLNEIITSITEKPYRTGFGDTVSDSVPPERYLQNTFGPTDIRTGMTSLSLSSLHILQASIEIWRYLRLCALGKDRFVELVAQQPLCVVRGHHIQGYPLLMGNHRALYALMHGITELPATVYVIVDEEISHRFEMAAQAQYRVLDVRFGRHDVQSLREAYKDFLGELVQVRSRELHQAEAHPFSSRSRHYRQLRVANEAISAEIPCISLDGYLKTIHKLFSIPMAAVSLSEETLFYRYLVMTQAAVEGPKLARIAAAPHLLEAPILLLRTRLLDYVIAGHTRLRARLDQRKNQVSAIVLHVDNDRLNGFLDTQASQAGYLLGNEGIRRMAVLA